MDPAIIVIGVVAPPYRAAPLVVSDPCALLSLGWAKR